MEADSSLQEAIAAFQQGALDRARTLAERQLATGPSAQAHHLLGLIDCRSGRVESGVERLRRAWESEPDNAAFLVMLARALVDSGRADEALEIVQPPAGSTPAELALWHVRAEAANAVADWVASAEAWEALCRFRPDDGRAWMNLGNALVALHRWPEAAAALRQASNLNATDLPLRRGLATALARAGRYQESADELGRWVEDSPDDVGNRLMFARLLADLGREAQSMAQLDKAAQLAGRPAFDESTDTLVAIASGTDASPDLALAKELARLLERTNRTEALAQFLDALEVRGVARERFGYPAAAAALRRGETREAERLLMAEPADSDPVRWHWLMARIADALGNPERAFAEAEAMNRSERDYDAWRARGATYLEFVRDLEATITPEWAAGLSTVQPGERRAPAFLVGFPRSGTTLLDTFLMGHPQTAVLEEVPLIGAAQQALGDMRSLAQRSAAQVEAGREAYFAGLAGHVDSGFSGLVIDKFPLSMLAIPFVHCLFPGARVVLVQRHPCDCVLSCFMQGFALNDAMACFLDIATAADFYNAAMSVWERSGDVLPLNLHSVVYEELVAEPEAALRPLLSFLGLEWRDELLDHRATALARSAIGTPSYNQVTQPLTRAPSGRWKRYGKQLEPVLPALLPWARRLGYSD